MTNCRNQGAAFAEQPCGYAHEGSCDLEIVTPRKVARGQEWYLHLRRPRVDLGQPPATKALCGSEPISGWNVRDHTGRRCQRCEAKAKRLGLTIPRRW